MKEITKRLGLDRWISEGAPASVRRRSMTDHLWDELPVGFLRKSAKGWMRLDRDVRQLVVELARSQINELSSLVRDLQIELDYERGRITDLLAELSADERRAVLGATAKRIYRL